MFHQKASVETINMILDDIFMIIKTVRIKKFLSLSCLMSLKSAGTNIKLKFVKMVDRFKKML